METHIILCYTPSSNFSCRTGGGAVEGSIRWWAPDHRAHYRYIDTDKDPCSVRKCLLYSHFGWMVMKQNPKRTGRTDISDLTEDLVVVRQYRDYLQVVLLMGLVISTLVAGLLWGDWLGGFIYASVLRVFFLFNRLPSALSLWLTIWKTRHSMTVTLHATMSLLPLLPLVRVTTISITNSLLTIVMPLSGTNTILPNGLSGVGSILALRTTSSNFEAMKSRRVVPNSYKEPST